MMVSMNSPNSSIRIRGGRTRRKSTSLKGSGNGDDLKYIELLEGELSAAQKELPRAVHEHTQRMSEITEENLQLQSQLKDWEVRYDEELRDFVQQHNVVERQLRSKNINLEDYASKAKDRVAELEFQLHRMQQALNGAEAANLQLEKRIEIMSDLLTSSPAKGEFTADAPPRRRLQPRPRSMLPRISNHRGSWIGSPERTPDFGASSPAISSANMREATPDIFEPLERIVSREIWFSSPNQHTSEGDQDDRPASARSATFSDHFSTREPEALPPSRTKSHRRMRRFGGGSNGPKPLILPYTSQVDSNPISAPPLDRYESTPSLPFRQPVQREPHESPSLVRPRAITSTSENALHLLDSTDSRDQYDDTDFTRILSLARQSSDSRPYSFISAGSDTGIVSRNLLEELHALKADPEKRDTGRTAALLEYSAADDSDLDDSQIPQLYDTIMLSSPLTERRSPAESHEMASMREAFNPALEGIMGPFQSPDTDLTPRAITRKTQPLSSQATDLSAVDRIRYTLGDLLRSPADITRMVVHVVQQRMHVPIPLISVPWWIFGLIWRPMSRKYGPQRYTDDVREQLGVRTPSVAVSESLAYGTLYTSPISGIRRRVGMAGPGKKRVDNVQQCNKRNESFFTKHHPLMWLRFSITLAYAVGVAFTSGPASLMQGKDCPCVHCRQHNE